MIATVAEPTAQTSRRFLMTASVPARAIFSRVDFAFQALVVTGSSQK